MKKILKSLLLPGAVALAVAVPAAPAAAQIDFSKFFQLGDSLTAGYMDGCWVEHGQRDSFGAIVARQAGAASFEQPLQGEPGIGSGVGAGRGCLVLSQISPGPIFARKNSVLRPLNLTLARPYNNMAVPGFKISDVVKAKTQTDNGNPLTDLVLRNLGATALQQVASQQPTFVTVFVGNNDVLGAAGVGTAIEGATLTPLAAMDVDLTTLFTTLKASQGGTGKGVVLLLPDVTSIPFTTAIPPFITSNGQPIIGSDGAPMTFFSRRVPKTNGVPTGPPGPAAPIGAGSLLTLNAAAHLATGTGIPCAVLDAGGVAANDPRRINCLVFSAPGVISKGKALPDDCDLSQGAASCSASPGVVLYPDEIANIRDRTAGINFLLVTKGSAAGYKIFDTAEVFNDIRTNGRSYGGITITTGFLSGGFFSYDGVHATSLGYALFTIEFIDFLNREFHTTIPQFDLTPFLYNGNTSTGGFPVGLLTAAPPEKVIDVAKEIYSPENWQSLRSLFGTPNFGVSLGADQDAPHPIERPGAAERIQ